MAHIFKRSLCRIVGFSSSLNNTRNFSYTSKCCSRVAYSSSDEVKVQVLDGFEDGIVVFGLNREKARNALNSGLTNSLFRALEEIHHDKNARVLILRSLVPGVFCAGADLKERVTMSPNEVQIFVSKLSALTSAIENVPIPVIAAIDGPALGGGLEIALACDLRTASDNSKLGLVETRLAIIPGAGGTQRLPRIVGPAVAKELIFTARVIDGADAARLGIVNYVVKQNGQMDAAYHSALALAREIIPNGPVAIKMAKAAITRGYEIDIHSGCKMEESCYAQLIQTKDRLEGLLAFKERRRPVYKGE